MTDIPDDIVAEAHDVCGKLLDATDYLCRCKDCREKMSSSIAKALMSERERCANIAKNVSLVEKGDLSPGSERSAFYLGQEVASDAIARAILDAQTSEAKT